MKLEEGPDVFRQLSSFYPEVSSQIMVMNKSTRAQMYRETCLVMRVADTGPADIPCPQKRHRLKELES